jgi:uncharacterized membrane protein (UPF0127 family)
VTLRQVLTDVGLMAAVVLGIGAVLRVMSSSASGDSGLASRAHGLWVDGRELCRVEVASDRRARMRGLLGRDGIDGAMFFPHEAAVHTLRMRFPIDVAFLDKERNVLDVATMPPGRIGRPRLRARSVLEGEAGSFAGWGLTVGSRVEISEVGG